MTEFNLKGEFESAHAIKQFAITEYEKTLKSVTRITEKIALGTGILVLKSIFNHLNSVELLLVNCSIESGASVAASLWEKSILIQFMLCDPDNRIKKYTHHGTFKRMPWGIYDMISDIVRRENHSDQLKMQHNIDLQYLQYSYLCAIKHGNPYTLNYLNRHCAGENIFEPNLDFKMEDKGLYGWVYLISISGAIDALKSFALTFSAESQFGNLRSLDDAITVCIRNLELDIPRVINASSCDFREGFWEHLEMLHTKASGG